jgi:uncharacterized OsmC-like protein
MVQAQAKAEQASKTLNGIDLTALTAIIEAVKAQPEVAQASFGVTAETRRGFPTHTKTVVPSVGGQPLASRTKSFTFVGDHPPELLGHDVGPTAAEEILAALANCVSGGFTMYGAALGIPVEAVRMDLTGTVDLQGNMNLPAPGVVRPGFQRFHAKIRVKSPASRADLEKLRELAESTSPVKDSLRAVPYTSELIVES